MKLICKQCQKVFFREQIRKFCSHYCYTIFEKGKPKKKWGSRKIHSFKECKHCGKPFIGKNEAGKRRQFCSRDCFNAAGHNLICVKCGELFIGSAPNEKFCSSCLHSTCVHCGKEFKLKAVQLTGTRTAKPRNYCSRECFYASVKGSKRPPKFSTKTSLFCQICGNEDFLVVS